MSGISILLIAVGSLLYYIFILRKFNSLGFRLFSLFIFVAILFVCWTWQDEKQLASIEKNGEHYTATVISKEKTDNPQSSPDNAVTVSFRNNQGEIIDMQTHEYISEKEWQTFEKGKSIDVIYNRDANELFVAESLERFRGDKWVLYAAAGFFFLVGSGCWFFLRKYKVQVNEKGEEWVEKDGKVMLDERKNPTATTIKKVNILSKLLQVFSKK